MSFAAYLTFLVAAVVVAAAPGPTVLQIFANATSGDWKRPASLIAGSISANALMVLATVLGLSALILASQTAFTLLRYAGSGYLIYLAIHYWRQAGRAMHASGAPRARPYRVLFMQASLTSLTNPKGLVFYIAFLPQFVEPGAAIYPQLALLGVSYIGLCILADTAYAFAGFSLRQLVVSARGAMLKDRVVGTVLFGAGLSLLRYQRAD